MFDRQFRQLCERQEGRLPIHFEAKVSEFLKRRVSFRDREFSSSSEHDQCVGYFQ